MSQQTGSPEKRSRQPSVLRGRGFVWLWVLLLSFAVSWHRYSCSLRAGYINTSKTRTSAVTLPNLFFSEFILPLTQWVTGSATPLDKKCLPGSLGQGCLP